MKRLYEYDGIDLSRMFAAFLAVAVHTYPLSSVSVELNFILVHVFGRTVVPFFMMTTGYFLLPKYFDRRGQSFDAIFRFIGKLGLLYIGATLLYLPVSIYTGYYSGDNVFFIFFRNLMIDGTFYHLWYLPAVILGVLIVYAMSRKCSLPLTFGVSAVLYLFGMLGDNYYGLTANIPILHTIYETGFQVFTYTRNGLFFAPVFLTMGALIAGQKRPLSKRINTIGFIISMLFMSIEGMLLNHFDIPRHTSMYLALLPCMFFLFGLIKSHQGKRSFFMRDTSMWIYILHPLLIVALRGGARMIGLLDQLTQNSIIFFLLVSGLSLIFAALIGMREKKITRSKITHKYREDGSPGIS